MHHPDEVRLEQADDSRCELGGGGRCDHLVGRDVDLLTRASAIDELAHEVLPRGLVTEDRGRSTDQMAGYIRSDALHGDLLSSVFVQGCYRICLPIRSGHAVEDIVAREHHKHGSHRVRGGRDIAGALHVHRRGWSRFPLAEFHVRLCCREDDRRRPKVLDQSRNGAAIGDVEKEISFGGGAADRGEHIRARERRPNMTPHQSSATDNENTSCTHQRVWIQIDQS